MMHCITHCNLGKHNDEYIPSNCTSIRLNDVSKLIFLCTFLQGNTTVKTIDLNGQTIDPKGAKEIAKALKVNHTVTKVNLSRNLIEDEGVKVIVEALKANGTVKELYIFDNNIRNEGAKAIAEALKVNCTITKLDLRCNLIGDEGAKAIAEALKVNCTITYLNLDNNALGMEGAKAIVEALKVNCIITKLNLWKFLRIPEIQDELNINQSIGDELPKMDLDLQCKTMTLGLLQRVPVYFLLDIHELVVILDLEKKTNSHKLYNNNYFLKFLESKAPKKRFLSTMDKINQKLI